MSKLDPLLKYHAARPPEYGKDVLSVFKAALEGEAAVEPIDRQSIMIELAEDSEQVRAALAAVGFVARTQAGLVLTGDIAPNAVSQLEGIPGLKRAEWPRRLRRELDVACPESRVDVVRDGQPPRRGAGVIVAFIDHGIDYRHPSFRHADGTTRILAIWDQGLEPCGDERSPEGFDYGVEYTQSAIDAALECGEALSKVRHRDPLFHGTEVAGVAVGNGRPAESADGPLQFVGVAPDADLIVVANTRSPDDDQLTLGDSADTLDGVAYILRLAQQAGKPVVINQSQGDNIGPHDGTSLLEVGIANLIAGPGRVFVKSAGNEGNTGSHAESVLTEDTPQEVEISIPPGEDQVIVDLWYPGRHRINLTLVSPPDNSTTDMFVAPLSDRVVLANGNEAFVDLDLHDPGNGDNRIFLVLDRGTKDSLRDGVWKLRLTGSGSWHAWIQINSEAKFDSFVSRMGTISIPGTNHAVITVGSYATERALGVGDLSAFSACGPTRDGRVAPTLTAPGEELVTPSLLDDGNGGTTFFAASHGTSISAPMVAGAAALMLETKDTLTAAAIRECLKLTARKDGQTGDTPNDQWGAGKLDAKKACELAATIQT
jgi:subtilisin family serine protease